MHFETEKLYKRIRHCWFLHTLYKCRGYVIIPKPHFSDREGINSHCRRFDLLFFAVLAESVAADHINRSCACQTRSIDHQRVRRYSPFHSIETCARMAIRDSLLMFFAYKKILGRTETRTRDRMYCQTIRSVRNISRDDRPRIATCSLRTPTDRQYSIDFIQHIDDFSSKGTRLVIVMDTIQHNAENFYAAKILRKRSFAGASE